MTSRIAVTSRHGSIVSSVFLFEFDIKSSLSKSLFTCFRLCSCFSLMILQVNPDYKGVCHIALAQEGHCRPGEVLLGTDSHTCNAGAFGQFATGIGNTGAGFVMGTGKLLLKVPPTLRFLMEGEMPNYLLAKDLILQVGFPKIPLQ
uniref:Aconitase/3-isopropylmalate dehydratase large subunit alpha/beta/alpha domain-containing protein n=1 Tax=Nelumbo nucifera TaxID=4432 RepID=A0A822XM92_NELNU|nr:TPA_asm: hypothetical protein HUJ06_021529 [Nelumbo nucifera]